LNPRHHYDQNRENTDFFTLRRLLTCEFGGGFTLIELLIVIAILGTTAAIAIPLYSVYIDKARITKAIADISIIQKEIAAFVAVSESYPATLDEIGRGNFLDPYGNPYQYLSTRSSKWKSKHRQDAMMNPLNHDYDLCSMGKDGRSLRPLNAKASRDDIVRAADGKFIGLAFEF
jgi:general secretion pathway protein G